MGVGVRVLANCVGSRKAVKCAVVEVHSSLSRCTAACRGAQQLVEVHSSLSRCCASVQCGKTAVVIHHVLAHSISVLVCLACVHLLRLLINAMLNTLLRMKSQFQTSLNDYCMLIKRTT